MKLTARAAQRFRRARLSVPARLLLRGGSRGAARRGRGDLQDATARRSGARSPGAPRTAFAAHTYNEAFRLLGAHPRLIEPRRAALRREALHAPVQDQRQGRLRRRGLAVAPGLRHLGARRRHARAAGDEHLGVPRRGDADQRPADAHPQEPQGTACWRPATTSRPRPIRSGRSTTRRSRGSSTRAASSRRPASRARC